VPIGARQLPHVARYTSHVTGERRRTGSGPAGRQAGKQEVTVQQLLRLADGPDGPSWSPYLMIGIFIVAAIIMVSLYTRSRRRGR
jgi:hypothetical protein